MISGLARRGVAVAAVAALAACATASGGGRPAALPPVKPGWRIVKVVPSAVAGGLVAVGPRDAWLAGDACTDSTCENDSDSSDDSVIVRHWDGTAWRTVPVPKAFTNSPLDQGVGAVAATSADAWIFAGRGTDQVSYTDVLHWTGNAWTAPLRMNSAVEAAVAISATDVWAFGSPNAYPQPGFVAHFDGKAWSQASFPVDGQAVSALSATDIWVGGTSTGCTCGGVAIEHWDGQEWHATPLPALPLGDSNLGFLTGIAAVAPGDVWADFSGPNTAPHTILLHWNGAAWSRAAFPYAAGSPTPVYSDGQGGIWLTVNTGDPPASSLWLCHYTNGRWTKIAVPSWGMLQPDIFYMSPIPGTRSMWASGHLWDADLGEAILKYGP